MAYPSNYYTPGGNLFTSTQNGVTTGLGGSVAAAPTPSYTSGQADSWMNGTNGQGRSEFTGMNQVNQAFMTNLGRLPSAQDQTYYSNMISRGDDINSILAGIGQSPEAQAFSASGATNPYATSAQIMQDQAAGIDTGTEAYRAQYGIGVPTNNRTSTFDPNSPAAMQADAILAGNGGRRERTGGRSDNDGGPSAGGLGGGYGLSSNPYQGAQADALAAQYQQFLGKSLAGIQSNSVGVGGLGGSRQGVAQGEAIGAASSGLSSALANLYGSNWNAEEGRDLQRYGMDQNYSLGQTANQNQATAIQNQYTLGQQGQRDNFYLDSQRNDLTRLGIGTNFYSNLANTAAGGGWGGDNEFDWQKAASGFLSGSQFGRNMDWGYGNKS